MGKEMQMEEMLYTAPEVAKILKTNVNYVYKLHKSGILRFLKLGRLKCRKSAFPGILPIDPLQLPSLPSVHR